MQPLIEKMERLAKKYSQYPKQAGKNHMMEFIDGFSKEDTPDKCGDGAGATNPEL